MSSVLATCEFPASNTKIMPDQSALRSVDLQLGHTFPVVMTLHFLHARPFAKAYSCYPCPNFGSDLQRPCSLICYNDSLLDITLKIVVSNLREVEKCISGSYPYKCPKVRDFDYFAFNYLLELWIKRKGLKSDFVICGAVASDQLAN